ncbi:MAG: LPP20 family lipoprotein [Nitrospira sp.]|nr:LPP20 family lipoprotein [Nitrospira sp.]
MPLTSGHTQMVLGTACALLLTTSAKAEELSTQDVRTHAEQHFQQLRAREQAIAPERSDRAQGDISPSYNADRFLIGQGQGDLSKGKLVCQRVSELAARADIAKQIRVQVKEHATDRLRERTGREPEQDIEVVREEIVQEYLQGVTIIDRRIDDQAKTCTAVAVMPKSTFHAPPATESPAAESSARH